MKPNEIRRTFLKYFEKNGHKIVHSGSLVPHNDPTLMFANSGMVQFKNVFTGKEKKDYLRATTAQKCVRAGGKHNDLENVGYTTRHHTFFEMLGNFSFGEYFKEQAIQFAWNLITKELLIDKSKLVVTVFYNDDDSYNFWKKIAGLGEDKIIKISTNDNFWSMGDTGPCGPCSEIFYDHGENYKGGLPGSLTEEEGDRFVEIWNLVFMQYEQIDKDSRIDLPKPCVDTGMGLERISAVLSNTNDNYKTDLFLKIINKAIDISGIDINGENSPSFRVISDHLRSSAFLIADGVLPSNEGRGYVLRRIMRRGMRHAHTLGNKDPLFFKLVPTLIEEMQESYPELKRAESLITETLKNEEYKFKDTLGRGLKILNEEINNTSKSIFNGETAFRLYDTYGFPLDLTQDILKSKNINVDMNSFNKLMELQKQRAKKSWVGSGSKKNEDFWFDIIDKTIATEFIGYNTLKGAGVIQIIISNNNIIKKLSKNKEGYIITNQTPFYGESGGQVGDKGVIVNNSSKFIVENTEKIFDKIHLHYGKVFEGEFNTEDQVFLEVDSKIRRSITLNHSATHLLHAALREVLGNHVTQKGSLVESKRLRFDFSHNKPILNSQIAIVEKLSKDIINQDEKVYVEFMTQEKAINSGAMALFGEKYSDEVRVITMGKKKSSFFSKELCGGTHVHKTSDIINVKIINQSSVASGIGRIEAIMGEKIDQYLKQQELEELESNKEIIEEINDVKNKIISINPDKLISKVKNQKNHDYLKKLKQTLFELNSSLNITANFKKIKNEKILNYNLLTLKVKNIPAKDLRVLIDISKTKFDKSIIVFVSVKNNRLSLSIGVTKDITNIFNAVELVNLCTGIIGGKDGGGRDDFAQGGGTKVYLIDKMFEEIKKIIKSKSN